MFAEILLIFTPLPRSPSLQQVPGGGAFTAGPGPTCSLVEQVADAVLDVNDEGGLFVDTPDGQYVTINFAQRPSERAARDEQQARLFAFVCQIGLSKCDMLPGNLSPGLY